MNFLKPKFWDKNQISFFVILLFPLTLIFKIFSSLKFFLTKTHQCSIPVICVGNIYLGGTGKTPLCIEIFTILKNLNKNPAFIRKQYDTFQDEVILQQQTGIVYKNKKRIMAINEAIKNKIDIAILDDGFQDFSIKKNLSIVCFNENQRIGNGLVIPSGPLRENLSALKRAHCVFINGNKNNEFENKILSNNNKIKIFYGKYRAKNIEEFKNKNIVAFAGIGNPDNFFTLLQENNINILKKINFPDHYNYSQKEIKNLINIAKENSCILLTTEKDYLRINKDYRENINFLKIILSVENKNQFIDEIKKII